MSDGAPEPRAHDGVRALFLEAARLPPAERDALLAVRAAQGDAALVGEVRALLLFDEGEAEGAAAFLATPALASAGAIEETPQKIGPFRILSKLGEGGMGTVFEAEQEHPRRVVALKMLHSPVAADSARRRFEREARLLARLHHPGIAQIFDAGEADTGYGRQPYIVMERVEGLPITEFARHGDLSLAERLSLFARVADAVQHAHDRGVIHRDLKPANIFVEPGGQPKILDFGIARLSQGDDDAGGATSVLTASRSILGTVPYLSPEQAGGRASAIDARADVYSLGVVLYELLTGDLPFDVRGHSVAESLRIVLDRDPTPPATRLRSLRGDVETILGKAMEKEPLRRYASAAAFAADVRRHLRNEPIEARPPSAPYLVAKFARRHRALVAGAIATFAALAAGGIVALTLALDERAARRLADANAYRSAVLFAASALDAGDSAAADSQLSRAPEALRDWEWLHLKRRLDESFSSFESEPGSAVLLSVAFSADGERVLVATERGGVGVRETKGEDSRARAAGARVSGMKALAIGPCGETRLDVEGAPTTLALRRTDSGLVLSSIGVHSTAVSSAAVSPLADRVAVRWVRPHVDLYDTSSREARLVARFDSHGNWRNQLAFSPDGSLLAFGSADGDLTVVDAASGTVKRVFRAPASVSPLAFSADGSRIASGFGENYASPAGGCAVFDLSSLPDDAAPALLIPFDSGPVTSVAFSPDGARLALGSRFGTVTVFDSKSGERAATLRSHASFVQSLAYSPDGTLLAAGTRNGKVVLFLADRTAGELSVLRGNESYVYGCAVSPDGRTIASAAWDRTVRLWDAASGAEIAALRGHTDYVKAVEFAPSGPPRLLSLSADRTYRLWDPRTGAEVARYSEDGADLIDAAFTSDGARVVIGTGDRKRPLVVRDLGTGETSAVASEPARAVTAVAVSPDGRTVAAAYVDESLCLFDLPSLGLRRSSVATGATITSIAYSGDGARLAITRANGLIAALDAATLETLFETPTYGGEIFDARFSPGGTRLAAGGRDGILRILDASNGEFVANLRGHDDYVYRVAWSPDGAAIVTASGDKTLRIWDAVPIRERLEARLAEERERAAAAPRVQALYAELGAGDAVAARIESDAALSEEERAALLREALRQRP